MSNEPTLQTAFGARSGPAAEARSDADRMQAALQRMETAMRTEPDAIDRLRAELGEMAEVIANVRMALLTDSDRPAPLLDDQMGRTDTHDGGPSSASMAARLAERRGCRCRGAGGHRAR